MILRLKLQCLATRQGTLMERSAINVEYLGSQRPFHRNRSRERVVLGVVGRGRVTAVRVV